MSLIGIVDDFSDFTESGLRVLKFKLSLKTDLEKQINTYLKPINSLNFNNSGFDSLMAEYLESSGARFTLYFYNKYNKLRGLKKAYNK